MEEVKWVSRWVCERGGGYGMLMFACPLVSLVQILPHPQFDELIKLCEVSFEVPQWWLPGSHDKDLLEGVAK